MPKLRAELAVAWLVLALLGSHSSAGNAEPALEKLFVDTAAGRVALEVEVARHPKARERGLMFRRSLPPDRGMLFLFGHAQRLRFWMKNTYLPLDMIFIADDGQVAAVVADTVPLSEASISPEVKASAVLEVNAGTARRFQIAVGDAVRHPAFGKGP